MTRGPDDIAARLLGPLLTDATIGDRWELAAWDADQGINLLLRRGEALLLVEVDSHDAAAHGFANTDRFALSARPQFEAPRPLLPDEQALVHHLADVLREREKALPSFERPTTGRASMVREIEVDRVLCAEGRGTYYINPYVGCMIGCPYCYVSVRADASRRLQGLPHLPWGRWVDAKVNAPEVLAREVRTTPPGIVRMSPVVTDPYQGIERRYRITRRCLEVLADAGFTAAVLTRAARIADDIDVLSRLPRALVGLSVPTDDDAIRRLFEPGADPIQKRVEALAACRRAGLPTMAFVQPMLPMDPQRLVDMLAPHVLAVRIDRMHASELATSVYARHGLQDSFTDDFFARTGDALRRRFAAAGVMIDPIEDLAELVARLDAAAG